MNELLAWALTILAPWMPMIGPYLAIGLVVTAAFFRQNWRHWVADAYEGVDETYPRWVCFMALAVSVVVLFFGCTFGWLPAIVQAAVRELTK